MDNMARSEALFAAMLAVVSGMVFTPALLGLLGKLTFVTEPNGVGEKICIGLIVGSLVGMVWALRIVLLAPTVEVKAHIQDKKKKKDSIDLHV